MLIVGLSMSWFLRTVWICGGIARAGLPVESVRRKRSNANFDPANRLDWFSVVRFRQIEESNLTDEQRLIYQKAQNILTFGLFGTMIGGLLGLFIGEGIIS
jgi:hypothetical protein